MRVRYACPSVCRAQRHSMQISFPDAYRIVTFVAQSLRIPFSGKVGDGHVCTIPTGEVGRLNLWL